jgi:hypothetical protein
VINTALAYNGKDRYPSAAAMKEALLAVAGHKGIQTRHHILTVKINLARKRISTCRNI